MTDNNNMRRVSLTIGGRSFMITTDTDEHHVQRLASIVDEKIRTAGGPKSAGGMTVLMLAALSLADDLLDSEEKYNNLKNKIRLQSQKLLSQMSMDQFQDIA